ncbi:MAG: 50S ribosomal protein L2 [Elusimicrobia bacterium RIFCSPLOWO2_12_FULL_59_9]|nr:MAG: 50S ribosomal protein L2 [Elusimicrobia bacterium RIFCSPLOWO2_12_FULL_59_9]
MPVKQFKPYTPSRRHMLLPDFSELTRAEPEKSLTVGLRKKGGRNNTGMIMVRHHGGGHRRLYRRIDFKRGKSGVPAKVASVEYDPNRSAYISLLHYADGEKRYILHAVGLKVGDTVTSGPKADIKVGNALPFSAIPEGTFVHNIELIPGNGGQLARSAGSQAQLVAKDGPYAQVKMPSGEIRMFPRECMATIGQVSHTDNDRIHHGNAGRKRRLGIRPTVRGGAMNAVDHPLGGGRGKSKGNNHPQSPWGTLAKGGKTRSPKKVWNWMIVRDRRKAVQGGV